MTCVHKVRWSVKRPEDCRFRLSVSHYKDRIVAPDEYSGATVVMPSDDTQTLPTKDKTARSDITVLPAPVESLATSENGTFLPSSGNVGFGEVVVDVEPSLESLSVTENGLYLPESGTDGYDRVNVNVPIPTFETEEKTVTENGIYYPSAGKDGISKVTVDVPSQAPVLDSLSVTQNGTYTPSAGIDGFDEVVVNVPFVGTLVKTVTLTEDIIQYPNAWRQYLELDKGVYIVVFEGNTYATASRRANMLILGQGINDTNSAGITVRNDWKNAVAGASVDCGASAGTVVKVYQMPTGINAS